MTITEFLLARIAEDEAAAQQEDEDYAHTTLLPTYDSDHQGRWDTARVLAECQAKRAIVHLHSPEAFHDAPDESFCSHDQRTAGTWPCTTIRLLAAVYADHPRLQPRLATMNTDDELIGPLLTEGEYQRRDLRNAWHDFHDAVFEALRPTLEWLNRLARRLTNT